MDTDRSVADWVAAYLEWIDEEAADGLAAASEDAGDVLYAGDDFDRPDVSREGVLLMTLRAESDCLHMLRQVLEADDATPGTVKLAVEGLEEAQRLLEAEQRAWDALIETRDSDWETRGPLWPADFDREWPATLAGVAAEVHALAGKVLELRAH